MYINIILPRPGLMRAHNMRTFITILLLFYTIPHDCTHGAEAPNLMHNAGFEERPANTRGRTGVIWSNTEAYQGEYSLMLRLLDPTQSTQWSSMLIPYPGGSLTVSAWLKAKRISRGNKNWHCGLFHVRFLDRNRTQIGPASCVKSIAGDTNWVHASRTYEPLKKKNDQWHTIPKGTRYIALSALLIHCTGSLFIDNVSVHCTPTTGAPAPAGNNRLNSSAQEELNRLLLDHPSGKSPQLPPAESPTNLLIMDDVTLPAKQNNPCDLYPAFKRLTNRNGTLYAGDNPVFFVGGEVYFRCYPWLYRFLGFDYVMLGISDYPLTRVSAMDKRTWQVKWGDYPWLETLLRINAMQGTWSYIDFWFGGHSTLRKHFPEMFIQAPPQHFIHLRFTNPMSRRYIDNFSRAVARITRKYPVFVYEFLNEIMYTCPYHPDNLVRFRSAMARKYHNIQKANKAWGTDFTAFAEIIPPRKGGVVGYELNLAPGFSRNLFYEYTKFSERFLVGQVGQWRDNFKQIEPDGFALVQATNSMWMDYNNNGVNPELMVQSEDALGCECGITYIPQPHGAEDLGSLKSMLMRVLARDVWRSVSPDKPIIDGESPLSVGTVPTSPNLVLADLHGAWHFRSIRSDKGEKECNSRDVAMHEYHDIHTPDNDFVKWPKISVPGLWGKQGFAKTYLGWYAKRIRIPAYSGRIFLNGRELADYADIYINGRLVHRTKIWSEHFSVEITDAIHAGRENDIAILLYNKYFEGGMYWGGIRGKIEISRASARPQPLTAGQMRSYLWTSVVHGYSATTLSYFYCILLTI